MKLRGPVAALLLLGSAAEARLPDLEMRAGEMFFRVNGKPVFVFGRNPTGASVSRFAPLFASAARRNEILARIHLTNGMVPEGKAGEVDARWADRWGRVFDMAAESGIHVIPVFEAWAFWSERGAGARQNWALNPYNRARGGPAARPAELFEDTECRRLFIEWLRKMVRRWRDRPNIAGWEVFSELDNVTGGTEKDAVAFVEAAAAAIRAEDSRWRPVTASLAGVVEWRSLLSSGAVDLVQIHPYARPYYDGNLADLILETVSARLERYRKPVLIGESGLMGGEPRAQLALKRAHVGLRQAAWAAVVSGAVSGRMLWWEDGYDQYHDLDFRTQYEDVAVPAGRFASGVDFTRFAPVRVVRSTGLRGAAIGGYRSVLGWFRDVACGYPEWPQRRRTGMRVVLEAPGDAAGWHLMFFDTETGGVLDESTARREGERIEVTMPEFEGSIAFRMTAR